MKPSEARVNGAEAGVKGSLYLKARGKWGGNWEYREKRQSRLRGRNSWQAQTSLNTGLSYNFWVDRAIVLGE